MPGFRQKGRFFFFVFRESAEGYWGNRGGKGICKRTLEGEKRRTNPRARWDGSERSEKEKVIEGKEGDWVASGIFSSADLR